MEARTSGQPPKKVRLRPREEDRRPDPHPARRLASPLGPRTPTCGLTVHATGGVEGRKSIWRAAVLGRVKGTLSDLKLLRPSPYRGCKNAVSANDCLGPGTNGHSRARRRCLFGVNLALSWSMYASLSLPSNESQKRMATSPQRKMTGSIRSRAPRSDSVRLYGDH